MEEERLGSVAAPAAPGRDLLENHGGIASSRANQGLPDTEMDFCRWPKAAAQKYEGARQINLSSHRASQGMSPPLLCHARRAGALPSKPHQRSPGKDQTQVKFIHSMASEGLQAVWWRITSVITVAREQPKNSLKKWIRLDKRIKTDPLDFFPKHVPSVA